MIYDYCIIGGGIVGLATAMRLLEIQAGASIVLIEKEQGIANHQTGHNSGVIHAGIYYPAGSLKARFCVAGKQALYRYAAERHIPHRRIGKMIVAGTPPDRNPMA